MPRELAVALGTGVAAEAIAVTPAVLPRGEVRAARKGEGRSRFGSGLLGSAGSCGGLGS